MSKRKYECSWVSLDPQFKELLAVMFDIYTRDKEIYAEIMVSKTTLDTSD
jgi:hypothetical protein